MDCENIGGQVGHFTGKESGPSTPTNSPRKAVGVSKRRNASPACSPARKARRLGSRLPVRHSNQPRPVVKAFNLPPDESICSPPLPQTNKVTPEKLMQELKEEVAKKLSMTKKKVEVDEEISIPFHGMTIISPEAVKEQVGSNSDSPLSVKNAIKTEAILQLQEPSIRPTRISSRIHSQIMVESPDLPAEDPLEIARQTLHNTKVNSGYKACQLVYLNEIITKTRPDSPEHAYSKQTGLMRHILKAPPSSSEDEQVTKETEIVAKRRIRFNRVLCFLDVPEEDMDFTPSSEAPSKPCLKNSHESSRETVLSENRPVIQVKKFLYAGEQRRLDSSTSGNRKLFGGGGAKRALPKND